MFGLFKDKLQGAANRLSGKTDVLEAVCACAALVAMADGEIEDEEIEEALKQLQSNDTISNAFSGAQIDACLNKMLAKAKGGGFTGKSKLFAELDDIAKNPETAELVALIALDIAHADGELEPAEQKVIDKIGQRLRIDINRLAA